MRHSLTVVFAAVPVLCAVAGVPAAAFEPTVVEVAIPGHAGDGPVDLEAVQNWRAWLDDQGFGVGRCGFNPHRGTFAVDVYTAQQLNQLTELGFTMVRELPTGPLEHGLRTDAQYYDPGEILTILNQTAIAYPDITQLVTLGTTYENRPIWGIEISDNPGVDEDEPAIQFNAQHHAREVATSHVVVDVIETLTDGYGFDPDITDWVNNYKTVCVPMVNPDGVQYVFDVSASWRKNRQFYPPSCTGVDLNRNYPYRWGPAGCGSGSSCSYITYRGPSVASELETQAMMGLADAYHFVMATSYHSFGRFIDYPYACYDWETGAEPMPEHDVIAEMMDAMAGAISAVDGVTYASYSSGSIGPLSGDDTSWYYAHMGTYSFIVEVGTAFEPPFGQVAGIINRNRAGWQYLYQRLGQARIDVHVTDACSGAPLEAEVTITNYVFGTGELPRETFLPFGRWTFVVPPNDTYTVRASKSGYVTQDLTLPVGTTPTPADIALQPVAPPIYGDSDCDGDVDLTDYGAFANCLTGPGGGATGCEIFDAEPDDDVDLDDYDAFQLAFTG